MTICHDCAEEKKYKPKNKVVGIWIEECQCCKQEKPVCNERDYIKPGERRLTIEDIYKYEAMEN